MEFSRADVAELLRIQAEIRELLQKYRLHVPAIVPAVACIRIAAVLLEAYPEAERKDTIETVLIPFLKGETQMKKPSGSRLILPPNLRN